MAGFKLYLMVPISIVYLTIITGTIVGNVLIILCVLLVTHLRKPNNILIINMALCDLLVGSIVMPLAATNHILGPDTWRLGSFLCDLFTTTDVMLCSASILNFLLISTDRYLIIKHPFQYSRKRKYKLMLLVCLCAWLLSALISLAPAFGWKMASSNLPACRVNETLSYQIFATLFTFYIPLFIVLTIYGHMYNVTQSLLVQAGSTSLCDPPIRTRLNEPCQLIEQVTSANELDVSKSDNRQFDRLNFCMPIDECARANVCSEDSPQSKFTKGGRSMFKRIKQASSQLDIRQTFENRKCSGRYLDRRSSSIRHNQKAIRTLGVVLGCFCLCWLPFFVFALFKPIYNLNQLKRRHFNSTIGGIYSPAHIIPAWLDPFFLWLGYLNSMLNPIVYCSHNADFYQAFRYIIAFKCRHINMRIQKDVYLKQFDNPPQIV